MQQQDNLNLEKIMAKDEKYYLNTFGQRTPLCVTRGEGVWIYDSEGNKYADLIGGIAVNVLGHSHPRLTEAICRQAGQVIHCSNYFYNQPQAELAERLSLLFGSGKVFFGNSGAEANEAALKLARGYFFHQGAPRPKIVSAVKSFHGRTLATATATGQPRYSAPFAPLPGGFVHVPYNDIDALEKAVDLDTCAVILEPIQGESGVYPASPEYMNAAADICRKTGARLIFDEVQTGMGRTGKFFAFEHYGVKPDIVTLAKGLAGGVPIGAVIANEETATGFAPGDHGSTFGGNPLACAAAIAVLDELKSADLISKAKSKGDTLQVELRQLASGSSLIKEVRGMGLMVGIELTSPIAPDIKQDLMERGFLAGSVGDSVIRLLPPLIVETEVLTSFVKTLADCLKEAAV